jgi:lipid-binding SYLF domain-containing protein
VKNVIALALTLVAVSCVMGCSSHSGSSSEDRARRVRDAETALNDLYTKTSGARVLADRARGVLVFPEIIKGGFMVGGQFGEGVLFKNGQVQGFYRSVAGSYGLQAGIQKFGYALFFMSDEDLKYLDHSDGWEIGVGPTLTVIDEGMAGSFTTTTARKGVFAFFFEQRGLMAGLGIQGTKVTRFEP